MTLFLVFHPPCLFVFSIFLFIYIFWGYLFGIFHFLIQMYLEFNAVRYPYHLSLCYYSITYPAYVIFSFYASFLTL